MNNFVEARAHDRALLKQQRRVSGTILGGIFLAMTSQFLAAEGAELLVLIRARAGETRVDPFIVIVLAVLTPLPWVLGVIAHRRMTKRAQATPDQELRHASLAIFTMLLVSYMTLLLAVVQIFGTLKAGAGLFH